jgi:uncharacterized membrane protein YagU involved in acid resistance
MLRYDLLILIGLLATLTMDLGSQLGVWLRVAPPPPRPNGPHALGRWIGYMVRGQFTHADIHSTPSLRGEVIIAGVAHYSIGIVLTLGYFVGLALLRLTPTYLTGLVYGLITTVFPWFVMFPALGAGPMGARAAHMPRTALFNHTWYGIGLAVWTALLSMP